MNMSAARRNAVLIHMAAVLWTAQDATDIVTTIKKCIKL